MTGRRCEVADDKRIIGTGMVPIEPAEPVTRDMEVITETAQPPTRGASGAFVSIRGLQLAFHRHLDSTRLAYLRRVRLAHAHRQLRLADPARETATAVAYRWGFSNPSRFTAYYRRAYGTVPSQTLYK